MRICNNIVVKYDLILIKSNELITFKHELVGATE